MYFSHEKNDASSFLSYHMNYPIPLYLKNRYSQKNPQMNEIEKRI